MSFFLALILVGQAAAVAPPPVPSDLSQLSALPWRTPPRLTTELTAFVVEEVKAGRCNAAKSVGTITVLDVDLAVLTGAGDSVRAVLPRAIDCPTVEQFTAGLVTRMARANLREAPEGWYRTTLTFTWKQ